MYTKTTPNLKLPQWGFNQHPDFVTDFNEAFQTIDKAYGEQGAVTEEMKENISTLTTAMKGVEDSVASMKEIVDALDPLDQNPVITGIKSDIATLQASMIDVHSSITTMTTQIQGLTDHVSIMDSDITTIKNQITDITGNITTIMSEITDIQNESATMKTTLSEHTQKLNTINSTIEEITTTITELHTLAEHANSTATRAETTANDALNKANVADDNAKAANQQSALAHQDAENAITIANEAKLIAKEALDNSGGGSEPSDLPERVSNLETAVSNIDTSIQTLSGDITTLTQTATNLENQLSDTDTELATTTAKTNSLETRVEALEQNNTPNEGINIETILFTNPKFSECITAGTGYTILNSQNVGSVEQNSYIIRTTQGNKIIKEHYSIWVSVTNQTTYVFNLNANLSPYFSRGKMTIALVTSTYSPTPWLGCIFNSRLSIQYMTTRPEAGKIYLIEFDLY